MHSSRKHQSLSLEEIVQLIEGQSLYCLNLKQYLQKMKKGEINQEEIQGFFYDIFNFSSVSQEELAQYLPAIENNLEEKINCFFILLKYLKKPTPESLCIAAKILEYEHMRSKEFRRRNDPTSNLRVTQVKTSFHHYELWATLKESLAIYLPDSYELLSKVIYTATEEKADPIQAKHTSHRSNIQLFQSHTLHTNWAKLRFEIDYLRRGLNKKIDSVRPSNESDLISALTANIPHTIIPDNLNTRGPTALITYIDSLCKNTFKTTSCNEVYKTIEENCKTFFSIYPEVKCYLDLMQGMVKNTDNIKYRAKIAANYKKKLEYVVKNLDILNSLADSCEQLIKNISSHPMCYRIPKWDKLSEQFKTLVDKNNLKNLRELWPDECPRHFNSEEEIEAAFMVFRQCRDKILNIYNVVREKLRFLESIAQEWVELEKEIKNKGQLAELKQREEEKEAYAAEKKAATVKYKEEIERKRQEKALEKKSNTVTAAATVEEEPICYVNVSMQDRLMQLKPKKLSLLLDILDNQKGVKFTKICNLITKKLGGEVCEIGSSHKRIKVDKYAMIMTTYTDTPSSSIATDGLFRQHGKPHTPRDLCKFNLLALQSLLTKANITKKVIEDLLGNKTSLPDLKLKDEAVKQSEPKIPMQVRPTV